MEMKRCTIIDPVEAKRIAAPFDTLRHGEATARRILSGGGTFAAYRGAMALCRIQEFI